MAWFMKWEQFMRTDLGLKGSELYVYAVIYGFTKSKGNFSGSLKKSMHGLLDDLREFNKSLLNQ